MIKTLSTIAVLALSFNQKSYAKSETVTEVNDEIKQEVSWVGFALQSFMSQDMLCYEMVKTEIYKIKNPDEQEFKKDSRFISCAESKKDITKSNNRYVKVTGQLIGTLNRDDFEYPVVMADKVRKVNNNKFIDPNIGRIKPRFDRSRLDRILDNSGR